MGGRASLILVLAFSILFGLLGSQMLRTSNEATDSYINYYIKTKSHAIATSVANISANKLFKNKSWSAGYNDLQIDDGLADVTVQTIGINNKKITAVGKFGGQQDTVIVWLEPKNFAQFGNFYDQMGGVWAATGDTFSGPFHTNDFLNTIGDPVWLGFTSCLKGVKLKDGFSHAHLLGGFAEGISIPLSFDANPIVNAALTNGKIFSDSLTNKDITVKLDLKADGTVDYSVKVHNDPWGPTVNEPLNTLAPNGVIYVKKGDVIIQGTLNGRLTVMANKDGEGGKIHIPNDLVYNKNPLVEASSDMLGLIAEDYVQVDFDAARGDIAIQASIYSQKDGLVIENIDGYPTAYHMNLLGGVIGKKIRETAKYELIGGVWLPVKGYSYIHKFDERFNQVVPPFFPLTDFYRVISWLE